MEEQAGRFITTEQLEEPIAEHQKTVWDAVRSAFTQRDCMGYWRYPLFSQVGEQRKEPDITIADRELGVIVIEVCAIAIEQITAIPDGERWEIIREAPHSPLQPQQEVEQHLRALMGLCDREPNLWRKINGRAIVALPLITEEQWQERGFDPNPNGCAILFQNHLSPASFLERLQQNAPIVPGDGLNDEQWQSLLTVLSGTSVLRKAPQNRIPAHGETRSTVLEILRENLYELDLKQEHIGKEIAPGMQRLRGIAGSGKTVLLCQKAAHMHLKHPDWDIALVFFTRTLYDQIVSLIDRWVRRFSNGEQHYDPKTNKKLRTIHAWGAIEQPGLYGIVCESQGIKRKTVDDTQEQQPHRGLAELCKRLAEEAIIEPIFDAILIDEGQDLVTEDDLKYQDKQAIYWLAYQALRPVDAENPAQRRLVWAYDEAQSLDTLKIPTAKELFGADLGNLLSQGAQYKGGIKKSEVMRRCYRTPGSILTAAHAIGMGLLRPAGMLAGITRAEDWRAIGYEVTGKFTPGQEITLHRPPEHSPNPVEELWGAPVLEFETYPSRQEELKALAQKIAYNRMDDGLKPSRDILMIILGSSEEARELEKKVATFLMGEGIDIYIPSALELNQVEPRYPQNNPNRFWMDGGVTISRVPRAKGNEADMVYVLGLEQVARQDSDISLRNQVFVALTRSRGWANLSGVGDYPLYEEVRRAMSCGDTFNFTYQRPPKRNLNEE
ncbi:DEAD/DEAH box helicase [Lusitaniella coriacea]|uniref:DEAD/DEAH box helicase n=1 Tax=Lusitaniella coriacea TaxID=1983105 RepID=UPI003CF564B2